MKQGIPVIGTPVSPLTFDQHVEQILEWGMRRESRMVCAANVHMLMEAHRLPEFGAMLRGADLVAPDGMPLVWMMRRLGAPEQERVAGMDLMPALCQEAARRGVSVYFVGSTPEVLARIRARLEQEIPELAIAGMESPPFRPLTAEEDAQLVQAINDSGAGLVLVALGCPKQERWMAERLGRVRGVMVGLGGAFPVYAGMQQMAPEWLRSSALEWTYRLAQEPGRLWKRYWQTNVPFIGLALAQLLGHSVARATR